MRRKRRGQEGWKKEDELTERGGKKRVEMQREKEWCAHYDLVDFP